MIPVKGQNGLYRDENSNAIVNCNDYEYKQYLKNKQQKISEKQELDNIKNEISEIKELLYKLLDNKI